MLTPRFHNHNGNPSAMGTKRPGSKSRHPRKGHLQKGDFLAPEVAKLLEKGADPQLEAESGLERDSLCSANGFFKINS